LLTRPLSINDEKKCFNIDTLVSLLVSHRGKAPGRGKMLRTCDQFNNILRLKFTVVNYSRTLYLLKYYNSVERLVEYL
jgi:hypothetical protein